MMDVKLLDTKHVVDMCVVRFFFFFFHLTTIFSDVHREYVIYFSYSVCVCVKVAFICM